MEVKRCSNCGVEKSRTEFHTDRSRPDGLKYNCKTCCAALHKKRVSSNKDAYLRRGRKASLKWQRKNKTAAYARFKEWREKNKAYVKEWMDRYYAENPGVFLRLSTKRRLAFKQAYRPYDADLLRLVEAEAAVLARMRKDRTGFDWHVDHIVPIRGKTVCGLHNEFNLAVIPAAENIAKSNRYWPDMP